MNKDSKIFVAGSTGMVGSAIVRKLKEEGYTNILTFSSLEYDLTSQSATDNLFIKHKPEYVFNCAAKVGGIYANKTYRADFIYKNLMIGANIVRACHYSPYVKQCINLGSSCIYPKFAEQPIQEHALLTGALEWTNRPYAVAKIAVIEMCEAFNHQYDKNKFISLMPTNLYGINDTYDDLNSHVIPAMIQRFHKAKINGDEYVTIWGDGTPYREFLYADDLADACVFMMNKDFDRLTHTIYNVGSGVEVSISELAHNIRFVVDYKGEIQYDTTKPNGTPRKRLNSNRIKELGWSPKTPYREGLEKAYSDYIFKTLPPSIFTGTPHHLLEPKPHH